MEKFINFSGLFKSYEKIKKYVYWKKREKKRKYILSIFIKEKGKKRTNCDLGIIII